MVASDGIFQSDHNRSAVKNILKKIKNHNPQQIIYEILKAAHEAGSNDDISIVLIKPVPKYKQLFYTLSALFCLQPSTNSNNFASYSARLGRD